MLLQVINKNKYDHGTNSRIIKLDNKQKPV